MNIYKQQKFTFKLTIEFSFLLINVDYEDFVDYKIGNAGNYIKVYFDLRLASTNTRPEDFKNPVVVDSMRNWHSPTEARKGGRRGLAPRPSSHSILAAPTRSGSEHTGQGTGGDEDLYREEAGAPVFCWSVPTQCCAPQVGQGALGGLRTLRTPCRDAEPYPMSLSGP